MRHYALASFLGLPTIQFLIACSMQKQKGKAWSILSLNDVMQYLPRLTEGGRGPQSKGCISRLHSSFFLTRSSAFFTYTL